MSTQKKVYYEMFSAQGEKACQNLVDSIVRLIHSDEKMTKEKIQNLYNNGRERISQKYPEVYDTEPREHIAREISKALKAAGYGFHVNCWGDVTDGDWQGY